MQIIYLFIATNPSTILIVVNLTIGEKISM